MYKNQKVESQSEIETDGQRQTDRQADRKRFRYKETETR